MFPLFFSGNEEGGYHMITLKGTNIAHFFKKKIFPQKEGRRMEEEEKDTKGADWWEPGFS